MNRTDAIRILGEMYLDLLDSTDQLEYPDNPITFLSIVTRLHEKDFVNKDISKLEGYFSIIRRLILEGDNDVRGLVALGVLEDHYYLQNFLIIADKFLNDISWFREQISLNIKDDGFSYEGLLTGLETEDW